MEDYCFLWKHVLSPVFFPNFLPPEFLDAKQVKFSPLLKSLDPEVKNWAGPSVGGWEGAKIISEAEAGFVTVEPMEVTV